MYFQPVNQDRFQGDVKLNLRDIDWHLGRPAQYGTQSLANLNAFFPETSCDARTDPEFNPLS
jgi:hypothetical protein